VPLSQRESAALRGEFRGHHKVKSGN
jgi:hypothetical protein